MAKIDQSLEQVEKLLAQANGIGDSLKKAHALMVGSGASTIEIDVATAQRYLNWLEEWGEKAISAARRAARKKEAEDAHAAISQRKNLASRKK
jgi:hypothetical protein